MGRLSRGERAVPVREAGELCAVEAIDREGLLVTSEGALVRFLRAAPKNPLVMSPVEREQVGHGLGQLAGRLAAGQSLQFYVEAAPVRLDALLAHSEYAAERAIRARDSNGDGRADALRRLHGAHEATMLSQPDVPPLERGITWSTVRLVRAPQYWHSQPSRANTARRVILRLWVSRGTRT